MQMAYMDSNELKVLDMKDMDFSRYHSRMRYAPLVILLWNFMAREWVYKIVAVSMN